MWAGGEQKRKLPVWGSWGGAKSPNAEDAARALTYSKEDWKATVFTERSLAGWEKKAQTWELGGSRSRRAYLPWETGCVFFSRHLLPRTWGLRTRWLECASHAPRRLYKCRSPGFTLCSSHLLLQNKSHPNLMNSIWGSGTGECLSWLVLALGLTWGCGQGVGQSLARAGGPVSKVALPRLSRLCWISAELSVSAQGNLHKAAWASLRHGGWLPLE